jgi:hypothetical protein
MLTTCKSQARRPIFGYFMRTIVACGAVCASILLASLNGSTASPEISTQASLVNRDHKGDRLPLVPAFPLGADKQSQQNTAPAAVDRKLPDGCESAVSPIVDRRLARIASRCIS